MNTFKQKFTLLLFLICLAAWASPGTLHAQNCVVFNSTAVSTTNTSVKITWAAVAPSNETVTYTVSISGPGINQSTSTTGNSVTFSGLPTCTNGSFTISANCNTSGLSNSVGGSFMTDCPPPCNSVTGVSLIPGLTTVSIGWNGVNDANSYTVSVNGPGGSSQTVSGTSASFSGLDDCSSFSYSITTNCSDGGTSSPVSGNFQTVCDQSCIPPTNLSSVPTSNSVAISWAAAGGSSSYTVTVNPGGLTQTVTGTSVSFFGLAPNTFYTYSVANNCSSGAVASSSGNFQTQNGGSSNCPPVTNDQTQAGADFVQMSWSPSQNAQSYTVTISGPGGSSQTTFTNVASFSGLSPCSGYTYSIVANCGSGNGSSDPVSGSFNTTGCVTCAAVTTGSIQFSNITENSAVVSWGASQGANYYTVNYSAPGGSPNSTTVFSGTSTILNNLDCGTSYAITIVSHCDNGTQTSGGATLDTEDCAGSCEAIDVGDISISNNTTLPAIAVTVSWPDNGADSWSLNVGSVPGGTSFTRTVTQNSTSFQNLGSCTEYFVTITSNCPDGSSPASGTLFYTTEGCPTSCPRVDINSASVTNITTTGADISWAFPGGNVISYEITYLPNNDPTMAVTVPSNTTSISLSNLSPDTDYSFVIMAKCADGSFGGSSDDGGFSTAAQCSGIDLSETQVLTGADFATISWPTAGGFHKAFLFLNGSLVDFINAGQSGNATFYGLLPCSTYTYTISTFCPGSGNHPSTGNASFSINCGGNKYSIAYLEPTLEIGPNPTDDRLHLRWEFDDQGTGKYQILDLTGRTIREGKLNHAQGEHTFDVREQAKGLYILRVTFGETTLTRRFIVQH